jgi:hypothetical protein
MDPEWTGQARFWIVGGYLVAFVASVVEFIGQFSSFTRGGLTATFAVDVTLGPVVAAGSLWTWWWLSKLQVNDEQQRRVLRGGVVGLIVVLVAEGTMSFTSFTSLVGVQSVFKWVLATYLLMTVGEVASAIGFLAILIALHSAQGSSSKAPTLEDWDT